MSAIFPIALRQVYEAQIDLVDERRSLEGMSGALVSHVALRADVQFLIDEREELVKGGFVAGTPSPQELGDVAGRGLRHVAGLRGLILGENWRKVSTEHWRRRPVRLPKTFQVVMAVCRSCARFIR